MSNNPGSGLSAMAVTVTPQPPHGGFGQLSGRRTGGEGVGENSPPPHGLPGVSGCVGGHGFLLTKLRTLGVSWGYVRGQSS